MEDAAPVTVPVGLEDIEPDHWIAWVFQIPGCFASGPTRDHAIAGTAATYAAELNNNTRTVPIVVEEWRGKLVEDRPGFIINALFDDDRRPLSGDDVDAAIARLKRQRSQLLALVRDTDLATSTNIEEVLLHVAGAERWYLSCLGFEEDRQRDGESVIEMLTRVRHVLLDALPLLVGDDRTGEDVGEQWSARKLVRRAIWHERDHVQQIRSGDQPPART